MHDGKPLVNGFFERHRVLPRGSSSSPARGPIIPRICTARGAGGALPPTVAAPPKVGVEVSRRLLPLALPLVALLGACSDGPRFGTPDPVTEEGVQILELWNGSVIAGAVVGAIVWGLIVWSVLRYRRRNDDLPSQTPHKLPVEVAYTVAPLMVVAGLIAFTIPTQDRVIDTSREPDLEIEVVAYQWSWEFRYGDDVVVTPSGYGVEGRPELVLPVGSRRSQLLEIVERGPHGAVRRATVACAFVPLVGSDGFTA